MPYSIPKDSGGDSKENDSWMESCVSKVEGTKNKRTGKPFTKSEAIAVCKANLIKSRGKKTDASLEILFLLDENKKE